MVLLLLICVYLPLGLFDVVHAEPPAKNVTLTSTTLSRTTGEHSMASHQKGTIASMCQTSDHERLILFPYKAAATDDSQQLIVWPI